METYWSDLPDIVVEDIFSLLGWTDRLNCATVCKNWYAGFWAPRLWRKLVVSQNSFTTNKFSLQHKNYQRVVSPHKVQSCLTKVGHHFITLVIKQNPNFHNLCRFVGVLNSFLEYFDEYPMPLLARVEFTFPCETIDFWSHEHVILGTGGQILEKLNRFLGNLRGLKHLTFNNLLIESKDTPGFMNDFLQNNSHTLTYLEMLNVTKYRYPLICAGFFPHLKTLVVSPTQLTDTVALMVAEKTELTDIVIVQDRYTGDSAEPVSAHTWREIKQVAPKLKVTLQVHGRTSAEVMIQPCAPVTSVIYNSTQSSVTSHIVWQLAEEYTNTLHTYAHKSIHRKYSPKSFYERADTTLVLLIRECPKLSCLVITERVSSCTVLVLASEAKKSLKKLYVRQNAVILKCDWPKSNDWSINFYEWLKTNSKCYKKVEKEVSKLFNVDQWHFLSDKDFIKICV